MKERDLCRQTLQEAGQFALSVRDVVSLLPLAERADDIAQSKQAAVDVDT